MKIQMVDLKSQYLTIKEEIDKAIHEVIDSTAFIKGDKVKQFEKNLSTYTNSKYAISCGNGTDALQIALMALDLEPGDEIITSPFTFIATAEVISLLRLKPVFVDIDPDTFTIDPNKIEQFITSKTKVIIPVHLYGQSADMEKIIEIATKHNLKIIEDTAQAIGTEYTFRNGVKKQTGTMGDIGCTSFFPSKNLGAFGDGGAIFTDDDILAEKIRMILNHGSKKKYYHEVIGVNSRLDTLQAAILDIKLKNLTKYIKARQKAADFYDNAFKNLKNLKTPVRTENSTHTFHQYTLQLIDVNRDELQIYLKEKGIPTMVYYPVPLHLQNAYKEYGYKEGDFPISEQVAKNVLSLPIHTELNEEQLNFIVTQIKIFLENNGK